MTLVTRISNISSYTRKSMSILINNSIRCIFFQLGLKTNEYNHMRVLVDTGAAMNLGYKDCHFCVMSQCPEIVAEYLQCDENTYYDTVQLLAALDLNVVPQSNTHDQMTAVVKYHTLYLVNDTESLIISFALDNDISLCSVLGLPNLLSMSATIDLQRGTISCS